MKLSTYKQMLEQIKSLPPAARKKAMVALNGEPVTDEAGNPVQVEVIELSAAPAAKDEVLPEDEMKDGEEAVEEEKDGEEAVEEAKAEGDDPEEMKSAKARKTAAKATNLDEATVGRLMEKAVAAALKANAGARPKLVTPAANAAGKFTIPATVKRYGGLKHFRRKEVGGLEADARACRFGYWFLAVSGNKSAADFCERNHIKLHQTNVGTAGGFLIPEEFSTDLIDLREQFGVFRKYAKVMPMKGDTLVVPRRTGGLSAYFTAEGAAGTESSKSWDKVTLVAKDLMVLTRYTNQLGDDAAINIGDDLAGEISYAFANKEDECGFNGDGSSTYGGIVGVRSALTTVYTDTTNGGVGMKIGAGNTYAELTLADFNAVVGLLPQYADTPNAKWFVHKTVWGHMQRLATAAGGVTGQDIQAGISTPRFLGYDVVASQVLPKTEANSQLPIIFGDLALAASFGDRQQDAISMSEHASIGGQSVFERNEVAIRGTERFDINVHDVGNSTDAGPVVGLRLAAS